MNVFCKHKTCFENIKHHWENNTFFRNKCATKIYKYQTEIYETNGGINQVTFGTNIPPVCAGRRCVSQQPLSYLRAAQTGWIDPLGSRLLFCYRHVHVRSTSATTCCGGRTTRHLRNINLFRACRFLLRIYLKKNKNWTMVYFFKHILYLQSTFRLFERFCHEFNSWWVPLLFFVSEPCT